MAAGYIKLHRILEDNPIWSGRYDQGRAWIFLLWHAEYEPKTVYIAGRRFDLKRGQLAWSIKKLAETWGWDRRTATMFLERLKKCQMITHQNCVVTTLISIVNYDRYQGDYTPEYSPEYTPESTPECSPDRDSVTIRRIRSTRNKNTPLPPAGEVGDVDGGTLFKLESDAPVNPKDRIQWNQPTGWSGITDEDKKQWQDAYPACNVEQKLKALGVWVRDNWPRSRKKNWARFISNNLARSQERGGDHSPNWTNKTPSRAIQTFSTGITDDGRAPFWWRKYLVKLYEPLGQAKIDEFMAVKYFKDLPLSVQQDCNQEYAKERDDLKY